MLKSIEESILEISIKRNAKRKESLDPRKGSEYAIRRLLFSFFFFSSKFNRPNLADSLRNADPLGLEEWEEGGWLERSS